MAPKKENTPEELEIRKVKALEKIANSLDALTIWVEEIDKTEWSDRIQFYLAEWYRMEKNKDEKLNDDES